MTRSANAEAVIRILLGEAALEPDDAGVQTMVEAYSTMKEGIESMYAIPEVRYVSPGLVFNPNPTFTEWAS
jgi:hypothetical protein